MNHLPEPSSALRAGRRALEGLSGFHWRGDLAWHAKGRTWLLPFGLTFTGSASEHIPVDTEWFLEIPDAYPLGAVSVWPAKQGGITTTFPHQLFNSEGAEDLPWRTGKVCSSTPMAILDRQGFDTEPHEAESRLTWHVERTLRWLELASRGELLRPGDPFELPDYPRPTAWPVLALHEDAESLRTWERVHASSGYAELRQPSGVPNAQAVLRFVDLGNQTVFEPTWGDLLSSGTPSEAHLAAWIRFDQPLLLPPWQGPSTWGELEESAAAQGVDLFGCLRRLAPALRDHETARARRRPHYLLLGFPIPEIVGAAPARMHWLALELPVLAAGSDKTPGFRPNEKGRWQRDRRAMAPDRGLAWHASQCWSHQELTGRGRLPKVLCDASVGVIGVGALGAPLVEMLVRAGVTDMTLVDRDVVEAGNLVRHPTTLADLGRHKSESLTERLRLVSPHARIRHIDKRFENLEPPDLEALDACDMLIDVTASDDVAGFLGRHTWGDPKHLLSLALSFEARRLYCFATHCDRFPVAELHARLAPWITHDVPAFQEANLPREGIGCWHPVLPARIDHIWMFAAIAVTFVEQRIAAGHRRNSHFTVYERTVDEHGLAGVERLA